MNDPDAIVAGIGCILLPALLLLGLGIAIGWMLWA